MNKFWYIDSAKELLKNLDENTYPETVSYLQDAVEEGEMLIDNPFEIANTLCQCDAPTPFTQDLIKYITDLYMSQIELGNAAAMNNLGAQYYDGNRGFEQSFEKAMNYYHLAAINGDRQAQENLGYCYYYGRDGEVDYEKAFHYFALGAFDGHLISLYKIGDMYYNGYFVEKNLTEAFVIYSRCIETMTEEAERYVAGPVFLRLGKMYLNGYGTEKDLKSALVCFQKAEFFLYSMVVDDGNYMYKKSLQGAIEGQEKTRAEMAKEIEDNKWMFE